MSEIRARAWSSIPLATDFTTGANTASLSVSKHRWECETDHDFQCPVHRPDYITLHVAWIHTCATYNENIGEARYTPKTHAIGASLRREHMHLHHPVSASTFARRTDSSCVVRTPPEKRRGERRTYVPCPFGQHPAHLCLICHINAGFPSVHTTVRGDTSGGAIPNNCMSFQRTAVPRAVARVPEDDGGYSSGLHSCAGEAAYIGKRALMRIRPTY